MSQFPLTWHPINISFSLATVSIYKYWYIIKLHIFSCFSSDFVHYLKSLTHRILVLPNDNKAEITVTSM